ncbi:MAG TPA: helix-turn-helix transcriptional regulator [Dehalococcoidia bacterium]
MRFNRELLKGNTVGLVLAILAEGPLHGYQIAKELERRSDEALRLGQGVLYPILHRLERQGLVEGRWEERLGTPSRKYYHITEKGRAALSERRREWAAFRRAMERILGPEPETGEA